MKLLELYGDHYLEYINPIIPEIIYPSLLRNNNGILGTNMLFEGPRYRNSMIKQSNNQWYTSEIINYFNSIGVRVVREVPIIPININHPIYLDFYFPDYKVDLEIDGWTHDCKSNSDNIRDRDLEYLEIKVIRIRLNDLCNDFNLISNVFSFPKVNSKLNYLTKDTLNDNCIPIEENNMFNYVKLLNNYFDLDITKLSEIKINKQELFKLFGIKVNDNHTYRKSRVPINWIKEYFNTNIILT